MSLRADVLIRRTYNRPLNPEGTKFETWEETVERVIRHQKWLWERAKTHKLTGLHYSDIKEDNPNWVKLTDLEESELAELKQMILDKKIAVAGRTLWLGGTNIAKTISISQFNCAAIKSQTVYDIVDHFWGLLNGSGMGFMPVPGTLTGFKHYIPKITIIPSTRLSHEKGRETNYEEFKEGIWTIQIGDSAEAWAKSIGKLLAGKHKANELVLDFSEIRGGGARLSNYGWISQGSKGLQSAYSKIVNILNKKADSLLSTLDLLDIDNLLGTVLSTRRSAQIGLLNYSSLDWKDFATAKNNMYSEDGSITGLEHRSQSNNSIIFDTKPTKEELASLLHMMHKGGKGEPGIVNGKTLKERAPWANLLNPCGEILLPDTGGTCNLVSLDLGKFIGNKTELHRAAYLYARANYRQSCVDFRDGILQESWTLNAEFLHLCGTSLMGIVMSDLKPYDYRVLRNVTTKAAYSMAEELGTTLPKNVTTVKPEGTQSKCYDSTEGMHKPIGKYIFNNVNFSMYDPLVNLLKESGYKVIDNPADQTGKLVTLPVCYENIEFETFNGMENVNNESAISQLERYKMLMTYWCDQNVSCTIYYDESELQGITNWLYNNWDSYVAVSFLKRTDPTKTAADCGYLYLPQEVVTKETYYNYVNQLKPVDINKANSLEELEDLCSTGVCPVR